MTKKPRKAIPAEETISCVIHSSILALMLTKNLGSFATRSGVQQIPKALNPPIWYGAQP